MPDINLVYYEDNRELREGLAFLVEATPGLKLLGAFGNCHNLPEEIRTLRPDVVPPASRCASRPPRASRQPSASTPAANKR